MKYYLHNQEPLKKGKIWYNKLTKQKVQIEKLERFGTGVFQFDLSFVKEGKIETMDLWYFQVAYCYEDDFKIGVY